MPSDKRTNRDEAEATVVPSSGNVFDDLGLDHPEERLAKADLAHQVGAILAARHVTPAKAAKLLGLDREEVAALLRGQLDGFTIDRLLRLLNALGSEVEIVVHPARGGLAADTRVVIAGRD